MEVLNTTANEREVRWVVEALKSTYPSMKFIAREGTVASPWQVHCRPESGTVMPPRTELVAAMSAALRMLRIIRGTL
jgi:hypothetical protein